MQKVAFEISCRDTCGLRHNGVTQTCSHGSDVTKNPKQVLPGEAEAGDFLNRMPIVNPLAFPPKSEKIPDAILSHYDYLPFRKNQNRLEKCHKPTVRENLLGRNYSNILSYKIFNKMLFSKEFLLLLD